MKNYSLQFADENNEPMGEAQELPEGLHAFRIPTEAVFVHVRNDPAGNQ